MNANQALIKELMKTRARTPEDLALVKRNIAKQYSTSCPSNMVLLQTYHELLKNKRIKTSHNIELLLRTRPVRSLSGIVNVAVLTKPYPCPGQCLFCPNEKGIPKSYLSGEPAVERAKSLKYDPFNQVKQRLEMLKAEGHPTDKIELRIIGGTWSYYPRAYRNQFIKRCFEACLKNRTKTLEQAQKLNEKSEQRIIGISIETRPDFINEREIKHLRELGITMVELGIQSIYDSILKLNRRGHGIKEIITATRLLKDAGFKVLYQMMLNLPGSSIKKDREMFKELFSNQDFQPDLLKIYPCALLKQAPLYNYWKKGNYKPYTTEQLKSLIESIKEIIPPYVRIQRITRDIPSNLIVEGSSKTSNLRQLINNDFKKCRCIRCREIKENYSPKEPLRLLKKTYPASNGKEIFLSFENKNKLYSLLRLRIASEKKAIIRELHTYGQMVPIGKSKNAAQHKGLGKKLMEEAEKIVKSMKIKKISVISGVGARDYYRKLGYRLENTYMVKNL
jgi:elongator complex protein 3